MSICSLRHSTSRSEGASETLHPAIGTARWHAFGRMEYFVLICSYKLNLEELALICLRKIYFAIQLYLL